MRYTIFLCLNMVLLMNIGQKLSYSFCVSFLLMNALLMAWKLINDTDVKGYFEDYWNYLDIAKNVSSLSS